jgi:endoglucanase
MIDSSFQNQGGISIPPTGISAKTSIFPLRGVNLSGMEFSGYVFQPNQQEATYYSSIGAKIIRLPFTWERLQPTLGGDLDPTNLGYLQNAVSYVTSAGMYALIDCHNFGAYGGNLINSTRGPTTAQFVDFWLKLNAVFNSNDHVFYDQMNEPAGISAAAMGVINQALVTALRNAGYNRYIFLESGGSYSAAGMFQWDAGTAAIALVDPLDKLVFEVHAYWDNNNSGGSSIAQDGAADSRLLGCTQFARQHGLKVFLGEFGTANNTNMLAECQRALEIMKNNSDVWVGWTAWGGGPAWGEYMYALDPSSYSPLTERTQTVLLKEYFTDSAFSLDFSTGVLPTECTFTRSTGATRFNASGVLESVANDSPRFDYGYDPASGLWKPLGLLIEPSATNSIPHSSIFSSDWSFWHPWIISSATDNAIISPDGTQNATQIVSSGNGGLYIDGYSITAGATYTSSCHFKWVNGPKNLSFVCAGQNAFGGSGGDRFVIFDATTGLFVSKSPEITSCAVTPIGKGWYRVSGTFTPTSTNSVTIAPYALQSGTTFGAWGAQRVLGGTPTSYIPTTNAAATRAADQLSFIIPSGISKLRYTFDDFSTQDVAVSAGAYTVPTNLNRSWIKKIQGLIA